MPTITADPFRAQIQAKVKLSQNFSLLTELSNARLSLTDGLTE